MLGIDSTHIVEFYYLSVCKICANQNVPAFRKSDGIFRFLKKLYVTVGENPIPRKLDFTT